MRAFPLVLALGALGCATSTGTEFPPAGGGGDTDSTEPTDLDGDGYAGEADCDDNDAAVNPAATELCNGRDDDCDGDIDGGAADAGTWYVDSDGDTFGGDATILDCSQPAGTSDVSGDCDDDDPTINPAAAEVCDGIDNDCSGAADDGALDATSWYADGDGDGYGAGESVSACTQPAGYVANDDDCNDADAAFNPGATEDCDDPTDYNCDGSVGYADADGDGYPACLECNDADAAVNPGAAEVCDGLDNNCDSVTDTDAADRATWYYDADLDGYGDPSLSTDACDAPSGYVASGDDCNDADPAYNPGAAEADCTDPNDYNCDGSVGYDDADADGYAACEDCDDTSAAVNPAATEVCDGVDNDCDLVADEDDAADAMTVYVDADGDGYGNDAFSSTSCTVDVGEADVGGDCDDGDATANPGGTEVCGGGDEDCDGTVDESDAVGVATWYADNDADTYGDASMAMEACEQPADYVADDTDCDDGSASVYPGADEVCNDLDDDCDSGIDEDAIDATSWYADADGDGFGDATERVIVCDAPDDYVDDATDCDDTDADVNPAMAEVCDAADTDEDCNGVADDDDGAAAGKSTIYTDGDGDGYGTGAAMQACDPPAASAAVGGDCDDTDADVNPGMSEVCDAADTDEDCNGDADDDDAAASGKLTVYVDNDGDDYGTGAAMQFCDPPVASAAVDGDCDDTDADINPGESEVCDGADTDEDCNGDADDDDAAASGKLTVYADADGDDYGTGAAMQYCDPPAASAAVGGDCDDTDADVNPGMTEVCDSLDIDEDCNGLADNDDPAASGTSIYFADADGDGFGNSDVSAYACDLATGWVEDATDCDDDDGTTYPGAPEICGDGADNGCDGTDECRLAGGYLPADSDVLYSGVSSAAGALGSGVAGGLDVDGDGTPDLLLADRGFDSSSGTSDANKGRVYLLAGSASGMPSSLSGANGTWTGDAASDALGGGVGIMPDADGDGMAEVVIGSYLVDTTRTDVGEAFLFRGDAATGFSRTPTDAAITITEATSNTANAEYTGWLVNFAGDIDDDGVPDFMVGSPNHDAGATNSGRLSFFSGDLADGSYAANSASALGAITGTAASDIVGFSAAADDLDGDGVSDIAVAAMGLDTVYVFPGPNDASTTIASARYTITDAAFNGTSVGSIQAVVTAGDTDGDGYQDLAVGADGYSGMVSNGGAGFLLAGPIDSDLSTADAMATVLGEIASDFCGRNVGAAGDVDGDGNADWLTGCTGYDFGGTSGTGMAALMYGPSSGTTYVSAGDVIVYDTISSAAVGSGFAAVGDVDGDAYDDFVVASSGYKPGRTNGSTAKGAALLFMGIGQ